MEKALKKQNSVGISGSALKIIAIVTMFIDHTAASIFPRMLQSFDYLEYREFLIVVYRIMRFIGRVAFPIFIFLMIEGLFKTKNIKKYIMRMGMFALISEIPFDLAFTGRTLEFEYQNVYFTLFIGLICMTVVEMIRKKYKDIIIQTVAVAVVGVVGAVVAELLRTDYGWKGIACIMVMYAFSYNRVALMISGAISFAWELTAPLAFIGVGFYNGKRGLNLKYVFYAFYPAHLLLLYGVVCLLNLQGFNTM